MSSDTKFVYVNAVWWPFGGHLANVFKRKIYADQRGLPMVYLRNLCDVFKCVDHEVAGWFPLMSDKVDLSSQVIQQMYCNAPQYATLNTLNVVGVHDNNATLIDRCHDGRWYISSGWQHYKPEQYDTIAQYHASVMHRLATPADHVKQWLENNLYVQLSRSLTNGYIAMHVRWGDKVVGDCQESNRSSVDVYLKHACNIREQTGVNNVFICTDNKDAVEQLLAANRQSGMEFNMYYDQHEYNNNPEDEWTKSFFQRAKRGEVSNEEFVSDYYNGFKIYHILYNARAVIGDNNSNMCAVPQISRNNALDVCVSGSGRGRWFQIDPPYDKRTPATSLITPEIGLTDEVFNTLQYVTGQGETDRWSADLQLRRDSLPKSIARSVNEKKSQVDEQN